MSNQPTLSEDHSDRVIARLARWILDVRTEDIPEVALHQSKLLVLDTIGCGYAAHEEVASQCVLRMIDALGGAAQCTVIGYSQKTSLLNAVLANGVLIRALDLNDYVDRDHPSDNIPVALCVAQWRQSSPRDMLAAIVVGYELYGRCKHLMPMNSHWDGTTISGFVATAIAGRLMGVSARVLADALGLAVSRSATSALARFGDISTLKALANPLVAQNAVQSAVLASLGATGPTGLFESRRGMSVVFSEKGAVETLFEPFRHDSYILQANVKTYPCLVTGQAVVAAALVLRSKIGASASDLRSIRIVMADVPAVRIQQEDRGRWDPQSREAADHCFQFLAAVALLDGTFGAAQFENERWNHPGVRSLMGRMELGVDEDLGARAPAGAYPCALHAVAPDGSTHVAEALCPPGFSRGGLDARSVVEKFRRITSGIVAPDDRERLIEAAMNLDRADTLETLFDAIKPRLQ